MKDIDQLKREAHNELRGARNRREQREAREGRDQPILGAYDRMLRGDPVPYTPGPRHQPRLEAVASRSTVEAPDTAKRQPGCTCQWEEGDSPCPVHGEDEG